MVSCANITIEKIRAEITVGDKIFVTPDIKSFNVTRARSQLASTFSASIEVPLTQKFATGEQVVIRAGTEGNEQTIFTGSVRSVTVNPAFERATSYIINLSGADKFQELEGKNISRRQRTRAAQTFAAITQVTKKPQKGISYDKRIGGQSGSATVQAEDTNIRENSKLVRTDRPSWEPLHNAKDPEEVENERTGTGGGLGEALTIRPSSIAIPVGGSVRFRIQNVVYTGGDSWTVSDTAVGTIQDKADGTAIYTQVGLGENVITFTDNSAGIQGTATAVGIPIHDHSSLGQGGPAFGVYGSE
jgi:hypothetical protein